MSVPLPDELSKKGIFSYGLLVSIAVASTIIGGALVRSLDSMVAVESNKLEITKSEQRSKEYTEQEVGGLRNDMQREIELFRKEFEEHKEYSNKRMDRKVENHEAIYHKEK